MIYGLSLLLFLLALVTGIPAIRQILRMHAINRACVTTTGMVVSDKSALGWLWTTSFGRVSRPLIRYQSPKGSEFMLEIVTGSMFTNHRYEPGATVDVVYDKDLPGRAYVKAEWEVAKRELWLAAGGLALAIAFWVIGLVFGLPF